jgi:hypothetical protein
MPNWFGNQQSSSGYQRAVNISQQYPGLWDFVNHRERQSEIHLPKAIFDTEVVAARLTCVNACGKPRLPGAFNQHLKHLGLHINGNDTTVRSNAARHLQCEKAHARSGFHDRHPFRNIGSDNLPRVMNQSA